MASEIQKYNEQSKRSEWAEMVRACRESGLSVGRWCSENGIPVSTYYVRQRKVYAAVQAEVEPTGFYEVPAERSAATAKGRLQRCISAS